MADFDEVVGRDRSNICTPFSMRILGFKLNSAITPFEEKPRRYCLHISV
jgi:hypothetical protein